MMKVCFVVTLCVVLGIAQQARAAVPAFDNHPALSLGGPAASLWPHLRHDAQGRLQSATLPASGPMQVVHDRAGQLRFWMDANGAAASPQRIAYRRYDAQGRLVEEGDVEGRFDPELLQRLAEHPGEPSGGQRQWRRRFLYGTPARDDALGPLLAVHTRDPSGALHVQAFRHDTLGRVVALTESLGSGEPALETRYHHDPRGRVVRIYGPASVGEAGEAFGLVYRYDDQDRLTAIGRHRHGVVEPDHYATYAWSADGRIVSEVRNPHSRSGRLQMQHGYDAQGRLTSLKAVVAGRTRYAQALRYDGALIGDMRQTYSDGRGAARQQHWRRGQQDAPLREVVDPRSGRLLQVGHASGVQSAYAYDRNGNVLRKTGHLERIDIDPFFNRAVSLDTAGGATQQVRYGGLMLERVWQASESGPPEARTRVQLAYYRGLSDYPLLIRRNERGPGETAARHRQQRMVWGPTGLVAVHDDAGEGGGADRFVVGNHHSSTVMVLDEQGQPLASYAYTPSGRVLQADGRPLQQEPLVPYLFQRQEYDAATGLHNYRARLLDSDTLRFLAPDPVVLAGQPAYLAMNGDPMNFTDPDGRMVIGNLDARVRQAKALAVGWAITFITGPIYMMGLHYALSVPGLQPVLLATGGVYFTYLLYFAVKNWRNDSAARNTALILTGTIASIYQATRRDVTLQERLLLLVGHDIPAAIAQVITAQGGPEFATLWTGHADHGPTKRVAVYMAAYATNSFAEVYGQALVAHVDSLWGLQHPDMALDTQMALGSTNMLVGNFCFYGCMAYHDFQGRWNSDMKTVQCKNIWMACRAGGRFISGTLRSTKNGTGDQMSDGVFNTAVGFAIDRIIGSQILANLPLRAVHGLFFPGDPGGPMVQIGSASVSPTVPISPSSGGSFPFARPGLSEAQWLQLAGMPGAVAAPEGGWD